MQEQEDKIPYSSISGFLAGIFILLLVLAIYDVFSTVATDSDRELCEKHRKILQDAGNDVSAIICVSEKECLKAKKTVQKLGNDVSHIKCGK